MVPAATTLPPRARAWHTAAAVASGISYTSGSGSRASSAGSPVDDRPAACVSGHTAIPAARNARTRDAVRTRPADGISAAHGRAANGVWNAESASGDGRYAYCTGRPRA